MLINPSLDGIVGLLKTDNLLVTVEPRCNQTLPPLALFIKFWDRLFGFRSASHKAMRLLVYPCVHWKCCFFQSLYWSNWNGISMVSCYSEQARAKKNFDFPKIIYASISIPLHFNNVTLIILCPTRSATSNTFLERFFAPCNTHYRTYWLRIFTYRPSAGVKIDLLLETLTVSIHSVHF